MQTANRKELILDTVCPTVKRLGDERSDLETEANYRLSSEGFD